MTDPYDPDKTIPIRMPSRRLPEEPTRRIPVPPAVGGAGDELPWWQTINQHRATPPPPPPTPPAPPRRPQRPPAATAAPSAPAPATQGKRRTVLAGVVAAAGVLAATVVVGLLSRTAGSPSTVLDVGSAQRGVQDVLVDPVEGYGVTTVSDVVCNGGRNPAVRANDSFTCDVLVDGMRRRVTVVFLDDQGTYAVDRPR